MQGSKGYRQTRYGYERGVRMCIGSVERQNQTQNGVYIMFPKKLTPEVRNLLLVVTFVSLFGAVAVWGPIVLMILGVYQAPWPIMAIFVSGGIAIALRKYVDEYVAFAEIVAFVVLAITFLMMSIGIGNAHDLAIFMYGVTLLITVLNYIQTLAAVFAEKADEIQQQEVS